VIACQRAHQSVRELAAENAVEALAGARSPLDHARDAGTVLE
jgi:hypothetical protein